MNHLLLSTVAILAATSAASAQEGDFHLGAGYTYLSAERADYDALSLRAGYDFTDYLGVEGEALFGLGDQSFSVGGAPVNASIDYGLGLFGKAQYPLNDQLSVFARLGYVYYEAQLDVGGATPVSLSESQDGIGYGVGAEWAFAGPNALRADYTRNDYDEGETDAYTLSYVRRF